MKFGKRISQQDEENAELHYINYKNLKKKIKDVSGSLTGQNFVQALGCGREFEEQLALEIAQANACFDEQQAALLVDIQSIADQVNKMGINGPITGDALSNGSALLWDGDASWLRKLVEVLRRVDRLRKYAVWNFMAVVKILKKRRKKTRLGLEDSSAERAGWLSQFCFLDGSDFAQLHVALESLGNTMIQQKLSGPSASAGPCSIGLCSSSSTEIARSRGAGSDECGICLEKVVDAVELSCKHRFCWRCFVVGPIAFQPGEYQITQCPVCRSETSLADGPDGDATSSILVGANYNGVLSQFLHTYFPQGISALASEELNACEADASETREMVRVVQELAQLVIRNEHGKEPGAPPDEICVPCNSGPCSPIIKHTKDPQQVAPTDDPSNFFNTLPPPEKHQKEMQEEALVQKLQWIQIAGTLDPYGCTCSAYCSLCSEPLSLDAYVTTPCKHQFHKVCLSRLESPSCPLCSEPLPFDWFVPSGHPLSVTGFQVVPPQEYQPAFPGAPSQGSGGYPLYRPPPCAIHGIGGVTMKSYLHRLPPGAGDDNRGDVTCIRDACNEEEGSQSDCTTVSAGGESSMTSNESDYSSDGGHRAKETRNKRTQGKPKFLYHARGKIKMYTVSSQCLEMTDDDLLVPLGSKRAVEEYVNPNDVVTPRALESDPQAYSQAIEASSLVLRISDHL